MKKKFIFACLCFICAAGNIQAQTFQHNIEESITLANESQKNILMIFSGSDWCKTCIQLKQNILTTDEFSTYSTEHLVMLDLDFPYRKKNQLPKEQKAHNEQLAEQYNQEGIFPKVLLLDTEKNIIGQLQYEKNMTAAQFIEQLEVLTISK